MTYTEFLKSKQLKIYDSGFEVKREDVNHLLFEYQKDIEQWALKKGKAAVFSDCGTGKTAMQLEWSDKVSKYSDGNVLIVAPLNVVQQTAQIESAKFGYKINACRKQEDVKPGINITNYEMLEHFDAYQFSGVVLDESSILKSFTGKYKEQIIDMFRDTPYKLACTATPSPNDFMELGNHSEFLGVMTRPESLQNILYMMVVIHLSGD